MNTLKALDSCHPYHYDKAGWKNFVAANLHVPEHAAFDYTAEFHVMDLSTPDYGGLDAGEEEFDELLPLEKGWHYPYGDLGQWTLDMTMNLAYFTKYPGAWRHDLYWSYRARHLWGFKSNRARSTDEA